MNKELFAFLLGFGFYMVTDIFDFVHLWLKKKFKKLKSDDGAKFFEE